MPAFNLQIEKIDTLKVKRCEKNGMKKVRP